MRTLNATTAARALGVLAFLAGSALAQHAQDNAVTAAEDAFGLSVGNQSIGLYSMSDARGFNPQQAGNLRIEGLYFDNTSSYVGNCTERATVMRVGITAQTYSFPSPTGIADLRLHIPTGQVGYSALLTRGPYDAAQAHLEAETPLGGELAGSVCADYGHNFTPDQAHKTENIGLGAALRWRPFEHTEVVPFWSNMTGGQHEVVPVVYTDGLLPPPLFDIRRLAAQSFTSYGWRTTAMGVVVHQSFGSQWNLSAGLFRAREQDRQSFVEEYLWLLPAPPLCPPSCPTLPRPVYHVLDVLPDFSSSSTSGELRLVRRFGGDTHTRKLDLSIRGRSSDHAYGGDSLLDYGWASFDSPPAELPVSFATGPANIDETRQIDAGAVYEERWKDVGTFGIGVLKSHYRRTIREANTAAQSLLATPWLMNARFTLEPAKTLTVYGSFVQGLEDSALAPYSAINRGQPPPATRTRQVDGGLRFAPSSHFSMVLGAFEIDKVYFNLDPSLLYTSLGTLRHRGVESSLAYGQDGLTVVAGGVMLRPHVEEPGNTAVVPLGPVPLTLNLNLDYAPARWRPFAASLGWTRQSRRVATMDDRYDLPVLSTLSAGLRYESRIHGHPLSVRFDAMNLTNSTGLHISYVGQVTSEFGRRYMLSFAIDR
ncbi:MAG TPA: hypothetical protein VMT92_09830 [Steroidobacteraceae bacterium]|nr:hypothetical protein [Steroidobacteraceae bacterium]